MLCLDRSVLCTLCIRINGLRDLLQPRVKRDFAVVRLYLAGGFAELVYLTLRFDS